MKREVRNKPWREPDWKQAYGPDPQSYGERVDWTLNHLKEGETMNKKTAMRSLLIAAVICMLLAGTALALSEAFGVLDFFGRYDGLTPREDASAYIHQSLGSAENSQVRLTVREAVYDGATVQAVVSVEALENENYVVMSSSEGLDDEYDVMNAMEGETVNQYARRTGRKLLDIGLVDFNLSNAQGFGYNYGSAREGDTLILYVETTLNGEGPATVSAAISLGMKEPCNVSFSLDRTDMATADLTPQMPGGLPFAIHSLTRTDTPFATYVRVVYTVPKMPYEQAAAQIDPDATYYAAKFGRYIHLDPHCSGLEGAAPLSGQAAIAGDKLPCPECTGAGISFMASAYDWAFTLTDADWRSLPWTSSMGSEIALADGTTAYTQTYIYQAGSVPEGHLGLWTTWASGEEGPMIWLK